MRLKNIIKNIILAAVASTAISNAAPHGSAAVEGISQKPKLEQIIDKQDFVKVKNIVPTSYWVVDQQSVSCNGRYNQRRYNGKEKDKILKLTE